jgi:hypothetical protein
MAGGVQREPIPPHLALETSFKYAFSAAYLQFHRETAGDGLCALYYT